MPRITIGTKVIDFPGSGRDANWSQSVIEFAVEVANVLAGLASRFDISPRVQILTNDANTNLDLDTVIFPSGSVRSFVFTYSIYRTNGTTSITEAGTITGVFDTLTSTWEIQRDFEGDKQANGNSYHSFIMSGDQMQLSTVAMGGSYDSINSKISYSAKTNLVNDL
jgi:hypothetical protein